MSQTASQPSILIVEDEWIIALDIKQQLHKLGYQVVGTANSGEKAVDLIAKTHPDLVLMDIYLQGDKSGIEAAKRISQQFNLPVVFLTAHADELTLNEAIAAHPYGYIVKPFDEKDLIIAIQVALANHRSQQSIKQALAKEKRLNELKSQFIAIVSHEFRNPLSSLLMSLEILEQPNLLTPEKQMAHIRRGKTTIQQMIQMMTDVLVVGQLEQDQFQCKPVPIDIYYFCSRLLEDIQGNFSHTNRIVFTSHGCDNIDNLMYNLDPQLLQHIIANLIENALKYSPEHNSVKFKLTCGHDYIEFQVIDQGIGLTTEDLEKLFTPFHRGINVGQIHGTGLGLTIVKKCVDAHGGKILVASEIDKGTKFTVSIPSRNHYHELG